MGYFFVLAKNHACCRKHCVLSAQICWQQLDMSFRVFVEHDVCLLECGERLGDLEFLLYNFLLSLLVLNLLCIFLFLFGSLFYSLEIWSQVRWPNESRKFIESQLSIC